MPKIIKDRAIVEDGWRHLDGEASDIPAGDVIVPLPLWQARRDELLGRDGGLGLRLAPGEHPADVANDLEHFDLIALEFPAFKDGRAFSYARVLRERYGFKGELRAVGDVARDQMYFMARCGINAFEVKAGRSIEDALQAFNDFTVTYQPAADEPRPLFGRG